MELILIPIITGLLASFSGKFSKWIAFAGSLSAAVISILWLSSFNADGSFSHISDYRWFSNAIHFKAGVDGISMLMLLLTNVVALLILASAAANDQNNNKPVLFGLIVCMQGALNGVFLSLDGIMFYIFWELALIPIYFICAMWGDGDRFRFTLKFFIYTFVGSLAMLASLVFLYLKQGPNASFSYESLVAVNLTEKEAMWTGLGILLAFAVKIPLFPLHSWQPETYTKAPAYGTMLLSAIMLKMGLYGLIRWFYPLVPEVYLIFNPWITMAGIIGVLYGALIAIRQQDMKRIVAFSSLSHVGLIAAGIATLSITGLQGGLVQMVNHGINVFALFFIVDLIQRRAGTRDLNMLGGIARQARGLAVAFMVVTLAATAVPFTNGFPGEVMLLKAIFSHQAIWGVFAGLTIILCAVYMLRMYQFSMFGTEKNGPYLFPDLNLKEWLILGVVIALVLFNGFYPQWMLDISGPSVARTLETVKDTVGEIL